MSSNPPEDHPNSPITAHLAGSRTTETIVGPRARTTRNQDGASPWRLGRLARLPLLLLACLPVLLSAACDDDDHTDDDGDGFCEEAPCEDGSSPGDCDDQDPAVFPAASEVCNQLDDDCDGFVDEGFDLDGDGDTTCGGDCDDTDSHLNLQDGDGDGFTSCDADCDDGDPALTPADADGDGSSSCEGDCDDGDPALQQDDADGDGLSSCDGDCDDDQTAVLPGAVEVCDGLDNDCDPTTDENEDIDSDGWSVICGGDCDDGDPAVHPGATEVECDGLDSDCDGLGDLQVPDDYALIQDAISSAAPGESVCVAPGTYLECIDLLGKDIRVLGTGGWTMTVIDGGGLCRVATLQGDLGPTALLQGFTLQGGFADAAGGLLVSGGSPTLSDLFVSDNEATGGAGGVYLGYGAPEVTALQVYDNVAGGAGGGVHLRDMHGTISGLTIQSNTAEGGAGLYMLDSNPTIDELLVDDNTAAADGGGVYLHSSEPTISQAVISNNTADYYGGLTLVTSNATLVDVEVSDNLAIQNQGGVYIHSSEPTFVGLEVRGNIANGSQTGLTLETSLPVMTDVEVTDNYSQMYSGVNSWANSGGSWSRLTVSDNLSSSYVGLFVNNAAPGMSFDDLVVSGNTAEAGGCGGVTLNRASPTVSNAAVVGNTSGGSGGGICVAQPSASPTFANLLVAGNVAGMYGGGLLVNYGASVEIDNAVFFDNHSAEHGGAICVLDGAVDLEGTILVGNSGGENGDIHVAVGAVILAWSDLWDNDPPALCDPDPPAGAGNQCIDPQLMDLGCSEPLACDYHLQAASPLVDAGDPTRSDPDGSVLDPGLYGGPAAADHDRDRDGFYGYWLPGPYSPTTSPGLDCDDDNATVRPGDGC